eukprot:9633379-Heterocapsa_arctica.AAC.1
MRTSSKETREVERGAEGGENAVAKGGEEEFPAVVLPDEATSKTPAVRVKERQQSVKAAVAVAAFNMWYPRAGWPRRLEGFR